MSMSYDMFSGYDVIVQQGVVGILIFWLEKRIEV